MRIPFLFVVLATAWLLCAARAAQPASKLQRQDLFVAGDPGVRLFVREVKTSDAGAAILLVHGARVPGLASFDLPVEGGSLAADLARSGLDVYVMDVRGYGQSTRPVEMEQPAEAHAPVVRSNEAVRDVGAVVDAIRVRRHAPGVGLFGWATGAQWAGYYASLYPEKVSVLILLNGLYRGGSSEAVVGHGSDLEDRAHPGRFNRASCGAYRWNSGDSLLGAWDRSIPLEDKSAWRDPAVAKAYVEAALASDAESSSRILPRFVPPAERSKTVFIWQPGGSCGTRR
ncbi:MAG TPA: alpha/beta fold hydrolase [Terriglobales bacterium]|nr:alpha/beta fold hydrolase [Terriglobales bacterium]